MLEEFLWVEKYRPKTVSECILPSGIKSAFQTYVDTKEIPNLFLTGTAGVGKTSAIRAMCNEIGCDYLFLNGSSENGIDVFRTKIQNYASSVSLTGGRKVIILDEADYLTPNAFAALRAGIEEFSVNCTFVLTGNFKNKVPEPILSRCAVIDFSIPKEEKKVVAGEFFKRVCQILQQESIEFDKKVLASFITKYFPDNRKVLNELQRYSVNGKIDLNILTQSGNLQLKELLSSLKTKNFSGVREWVVSNIDNDPNTLFRKIYDGMFDFLKPNSIPQMVLIIDEYQYKMNTSAVDPEITMMAFFVRIMVELEFN